MSAAASPLCDSFHMVERSGLRLGLPDDLQSKLVSLVIVLRRQPADELAIIDLSSGEPTIR